MQNEHPLDVLHLMFGGSQVQKPYRASTNGFLTYSNSAKYCTRSDSSEREILRQKSLPCVRLSSLSFALCYIVLTALFYWIAIKHVRSVFLSWTDPLFCPYAKNSIFRQKNRKMYTHFPVPVSSALSRQRRSASRARKKPLRLYGLIRIQLSVFHLQHIYNYTHCW